MAALNPEYAAATPGHFAFHVSGGRWAYPDWIRYLNEVITEFLLDPTERFLVIEAPVRHGKETRVDEPILTTDGWTTVGELTPGDHVFGVDGQPTKVLGITPVNPAAPKMRVTLSDGTSVDVHPRHEWTVRRRNGHGRWFTAETQHLASLKLKQGTGATSRYAYQLPHRPVVDTPDADLPIDPYLIGYWIGDGSTAQGNPLAAGRDADELEAILTACGEAPHRRFTQPNTGCEYLRIPTLRRRLTAMGIGHTRKTIPAACWTSSPDQRRALLQGIVDSDGHVERGTGRVRVVGHDHALITEIADLARSLGHRATTWAETDTRSPHTITDHHGAEATVRTAGTRHVASWTPTDGRPPGRLARKQFARPARTAERVAIASIEPAPPADGVCIQVDRADGLYLVGRSFIPTHNSLFCSVHVPAWFLGMFPDRQVLLATYSRSLSRGFGTQVRDLLEAHGERLFGIKVRSDFRSSEDWKIAEHNGGMRSVARTGTIIGTGAHLLVIDDPFKDIFEALDPKVREHLYEWYTGTIRHRLEPGAKVILVMSRWHEDDLSARLLNDLDPDSDRWERVHLPAIATPPPWEIEAWEAAHGAGSFDETLWRDPLGRQVGEALWPERWPRDKLLRTKASVGPSIWAAQFQQIPTTPGDEMFPVHLWGKVDALPTKIDLVRRWDMGGDTGDWTAGSLVGRDRDGNTYIVDVRRIRGQDSEKEKLVRSTAEEDKERFGAVHIVIEQEPGSSGKTVADGYVREVLAGFDAEAKPTKRNKVLNAQPLAAQQQAGNVYLLREPLPDGTGLGQASWWRMFAEEARDFPRGVNDDMVDTAAQAYNDLVERARGRVKKPAKATSAAKRSLAGGPGQGRGSGRAGRPLT